MMDITTESEGLGAIGLPQGFTTITCETCQESFDLSSVYGQQEWKRHQEVATRAVMQSLVELHRALGLIGRKFRVVYVPRYPDYEGHTLGYLDVTVKCLRIVPRPCSVSQASPVLVLDQELPSVTSSWGGSPFAGVTFTSTPFLASEVLARLGDGDRMTYQPCGKDSWQLEQEIAAYLQRDV